MKMRFGLCVVLAVAGVVAASCGGGSSGGGRSSGEPLPSAAAAKKAAGGGGALIVANATGIVEYNIKDRTEKPLIPAGNGAFVLDPALSADGTKLAYVVQPPPKVEGAKYDAGSDVWIADRDGSGQRVVFAHAQPNQLVRFPQWEDAGHLLAVVQEIATAEGQTRVVYTLERIDATSGERAKVLEDVLTFALSPDGTRMVYARLVQALGETLEASDAGGGNSATLVGADQHLSPFNSPRFSPDGTKVAFASADQTGARAAVEYVSVSRSGGAAVEAEDAALLDGLPEDIWTVDAAGGQAVRMADLKEDLPSLTWSGDGKDIYVLGSAGLYDVSIESGAVTRLGEGAFHGQVVWSRGG